MHNTIKKIVFVCVLFILAMIPSSIGGWVRPNDDSAGTSTSDTNYYLNMANCITDDCLFNSTDYYADYLVFIGNGDFYYVGEQP